MFYHKTNKLSSKNTLIEFLGLLPIIIAIAIIPIIVYLKMTPVKEAASFWISDMDYDFFSYYKSIFLYISSGLSLIIIFCKAIISRSHFKKTHLYIPLLVFLVFVLLSALLSKYPKISWFGFYNRY